MTISAITIQNFKGIREPVRIELSPITLLFGANSAGKSTVLQALLYAREILGRLNTDPDKTVQGGTAIDLGGFRTMVHKHDLELPIELGFHLDLDGIDLVDYSNHPESQFADQLSLDTDSAWVNLSVKWSERLADAVQADYEVGINGIAFARVETNPEDAASHSVKVNTKHPWLGPRDETDAASAAPLSAKSGTTEGEETSWETASAAVVGAVRSPARIETLFDELAHVLEAHDLKEMTEVVAFGLIAPGEYLLSVLGKLRYLGPIREVPERNYVPALSPDEGRWANGLAAWDWLSSAPREKVDDLNAWLSRDDRLGTGYRVEVKRFKELDTDEMLYLGLMQGTDVLDNISTIRKGLEALPARTKIILRQERDFLPVMPQDVGIGISQLVPVVVSALDAHDGITVIEQPELHIHPAIQVGLGDLFISQTQGEEAGDRIFIIETHSEHLLLRLLRRIREASDSRAVPKLRPESLAVYYVEATAEGTEIRRLRVTDEGRFVDQWPRGFFEEREKEFFGEPEDLREELKKFFPQ